MKKRHRYPQQRQPRDISYSESWRVTKEYGLSTIKEIWEQKGMYRTGEQLNTSAEVIRHIAKQNNWKRPAEKAPAILQGVKNGNLDPKQFKTLDFSNCNLNLKEDKMKKDKITHNNFDKLFLRYLRQYSGSFTCCNEIKEWMNDNSKLSKARTIAEFKQGIGKSRDFENRHLKKVDVALEYFKDRLASIVLQEQINTSDIP